MTFKIKHENFTNLIVCLVSTVLAFLFLFLIPEISVYAWPAFMAIASVSAVLYFVEQLVGTAVVIEDRTIIIKYFLGRKRIAVEEICNLNIEKYKRRRRKPRIHTEYRMKMTIELLSGKKIVLTDDATAVKGAIGFFLGIYEEVPDEDVNLHKAYQAIRQRCVKYNGWQIAEPTYSGLHI